MSFLSDSFSFEFVSGDKRCDVTELEETCSELISMVLSVEKVYEATFKRWITLGKDMDNFKNYWKLKMSIKTYHVFNHQRTSTLNIRQSQIHKHTRYFVKVNCQRHIPVISVNIPTYASSKSSPTKLSIPWAD